MRERRRFVRFDLNTELIVETGTSDERISARTKNIGALGMCFVSDKQWPIGQVLYVQCLLPNSHHVRLQAEVVWSKIIDPKEGYRTGLKVLGVQEGEETNFMMFYCDRLMEEYYNWRNHHPKH